MKIQNDGLELYHQGNENGNMELLSDMDMPTKLCAAESLQDNKSQEPVLHEVRVLELNEKLDHK